MKKNLGRWNHPIIFALVLSLLAVHAFAQSITDPSPPSGTQGGSNGVGGNAGVAPPGQTSGQATDKTVAWWKSGKKSLKNKNLLLAANNAAWQALLSEPRCTGTVTDDCATAAIALAESTCSTSAILFQKDTKGWQIADFAFIVASAAFTGVGASTTLAQAKVFSTLGGTTGLGAVTSTLNANITSDQAGITSIIANQNDLQTFLLSATAGADLKSLPTDTQILQRALIDSNKCISAATGSTGTSNSPTSPQQAAGQQTTQQQPAQQQPAQQQPAQQQPAPDKKQ
jgi:hypothetical protein